MTSESDASELSEINCLLFGRCPDSRKDAEAIKRLTTLVERQVPSALTTMASLIWQGFGITKNSARAFALAKQAAELGHAEALVLMASMHFEGAGCEQSLTKAIELINRFDDEAESIPLNLHISDAGPDYYNLLTEFVVRVNGCQAEAPLETLEQIIRWLVDCKRKVITKQAAILQRSPVAFGGISYRTLPFHGAIGGAVSLLKGTDTITHIGMKDGWTEESVWFETNLFKGWPEGLSFGNLTEFEDLQASELGNVRAAYEAHKHTEKQFVLELVSSSVHRSTTLYCGDDEVMQAYED